ncbi:Endonuclease/exonuclease/phosphatase [Infundibulicybe gibba]|nr:Endonuclease/exonuclease/phosphatase [Infundibulicybe gibba]
MHSFDSVASTWIQVPSATTAGDSLTHTLQSNITSTLAVLTWNVDFAQAFPDLRFRALLSYLKSIFSSSPSEYPKACSTIILIQEFDMDNFEVLLADSFVQEIYNITDISPACFTASYGTITLIPKILTSCVSSVLRVPFPGSSMGRDALYVDLIIPYDVGDLHLRIANTHLESLRGNGDIERPLQLASILKTLSVPGINGGLVGGDMNAIAPTDIGLPERLGFSDAWSAVHLNRDPRAGETDPEGLAGGQSSPDHIDSHTWGYQPRSIYPPARLDKILLLGTLKVERIERVGVGLRVEGSEADGEWVSDHYGLLAKISIGSA